MVTSGLGLLKLILSAAHKSDLMKRNSRGACIDREQCLHCEQIKIYFFVSPAVTPAVIDAPKLISNSQRWSMFEGS